MQPEPVILGTHPRSDLRELAERATSAGAAEDLAPALELARRVGAELPRPGGGETLSLWEALATLGAADLTVARVVEPHLDALAILKEAGGTEVQAPAAAIWGVFAAEGGGGRLSATLGPEGRWSLTGPKPWCSLADVVTHALITAWVDEEQRGLFLVDLDDPGVRSQQDQGPWVARGLARVRSTGLLLEEVPATAVGGPGWYLERPGFAWGGIGVAAIWFGAAVAVGRRLRAASLRREPDQIALAHLGAVDTALSRARAVLVDAAYVVDGPSVSPVGAQRLALRVRQVVADAVEEVLTRAGHALGPGPLALEEEHARRVVDLGLYVRQHHAERDAAALGATVLGPVIEGEWSWW